MPKNHLKYFKNFIKNKKLQYKHFLKISNIYAVIRFGITS